MGFQTTIVILNDAAHEIPNDKDFPRKLYEAILMMAGTHRDRLDVSIGCHVNACQVIAQEHADINVIIASGGNSGRIIGHGSCYNSDHTLLRRLAKQHGFRLVRETKGEKMPGCEDCTAGTPIGTCYDCGAILTDKGVCPKEPQRHRR